MSTSPETVPAKDEDGYFWVMGRVDDVTQTCRAIAWAPWKLNRPLVSHPAVAEAAVVGRKDEVKKGKHIFAFVILEGHYSPSDDLKAELKQHVVAGNRYYCSPWRNSICRCPAPKPARAKSIRRFLRNLASGGSHRRRCLHHGRPERARPAAAGLVGSLLGFVSKGIAGCYGCRRPEFPAPFFVFTESSLRHR